MRVVLRAVLVLGAMMAIVGCESGSEPRIFPPPILPPPPPDLTSPQGVLISFEIAYRFKDIDGYAALIHDDFVFKPSEHSPVEFDQLNRAQELAATDSMFKFVIDIEIRIDQGPVEDSTHPDYPASEGFKMMTVPSAYMAIESRDEVDGSPVTELMNGDPTFFVFAPDSSENPVTWQIICHDEGAASDSTWFWSVFKERYLPAP